MFRLHYPVRAAMAMISIKPVVAGPGPQGRGPMISIEAADPGARATGLWKAGTVRRRAEEIRIGA
jgi:hypothetical protein